MMKHAQYLAPTSLADFSSTWFSACMQPWTMWQDWTQAWLKSVASMPSAWLPALAAERKNQPASIDFFLPWMPRVEALVTPLDGHSTEDAMRVMMRAALPFLGGQGGESVLVDAKVVRHRAEALIKDAVPAPSGPPATPLAVAEVVAMPQRKLAVAPPTLAKPAAAKPAAAKPAAAKPAAAKPAAAKPAAAKPAAAKTAATKTAVAKTAVAKTAAAKPAAAKPAAAKPAAAKPAAAKPAAAKPAAAKPAAVKRAPRQNPKTAGDSGPK